MDDKKFSLETTLAAHQRWVWDCAFSADSAYLVTACSDHYARLWELSRYVIEGSFLVFAWVGCLLGSLVA